MQRDYSEVKGQLRSQEWFNNPHNMGMTAVYVERYMNYGWTREELQSGKPVIGIAQTGGDLTPCNRIHVELGRPRQSRYPRQRGVSPLNFPFTPLPNRANGPRPHWIATSRIWAWSKSCTAIPLTAWCLPQGCDKTTPACIMGACTLNLPAIVLSGGPMLDGHFQGRLAGSGTVVWEARERHAAGGDRLRRVYGPRHVLLAQPGPLQHDGHGPVHERFGRSLGLVPDGLCGHSRALSRPQTDGLWHGPPHRGYGQRRPHPGQNFDAQSLSKRHCGQLCARGIDQCAGSHHRDSATHRARAPGKRLANLWSQHPLARQLPARRANTWARRFTAPGACPRSWPNSSKQTNSTRTA